MPATCGAGHATTSNLTRRACRRTCSVCGAACTTNATSIRRVRDAAAHQRMRQRNSHREPLGGAATFATVADPHWYQDAVVYQLHVKAFFDSNDDGIGDFRGLTERLDYVRDLGVNTIWLLPFYPSPLRDDGYDVADYEGVHPPYGALADFQHFVREA